MTAAKVYSKNSRWALQKAKDAEYFFEEGARQDIISFLEAMLPKPPPSEDESDSKTSERKSDNNAALFCGSWPHILTIAILALTSSLQITMV